MRVVLANGTSVDLGKVEITPTIGITDYSRRVTDDFGVTTVVPRKFSRRMSMRLAVPNARADEVYNQLVALRAKTATFIADDRYAWLQAEGRIKEFEFAYQTGDQTYYTLSIDGIAETEGITDTGVDPSASGKPSAFKLVQPVSVTDAVLTSSSVVEGDAQAWSASSTYAKGATVTRAHRVFESLTDGNAGADPTADAAKWLDTGPTNRWAMFDEALGTSTIASAAVEVVLKTVNAISALALLDTNAASVRVRAPGYDRTVVPNGAGQAIFLDLAVAASADITVTVTPAAVNPGPQYWDDGAQWMDAGVWSDSLAAGDGTVTIGTFLFGVLKGLGATETGVTAGITDYSRKDTDEFGEVTIVERSWSKRMAAKTLIRSDAVDVVADRLAGVRARPSLWIARTNTDSLTIYGYPKDWSIEVGLNTSKLSLSVEGLGKAASRRTSSLGGPVDYADLTDRTGTKPAPGADKTSENTSKDTENVGGRPADSVLDGIAGNTFHQALAAADAEVARLRTRALNFPGPAGEDSYTLHRREVIERKSADGVFAETFEILGARTPGGQAFVINTSTVMIGADESFAQRFDAIAASFGKNNAAIEHIDQVLVGPSGAEARALVKVDVNGRIIGTALTNDGTEGAFVISADNFRLEDPDTGKPYLYADDTGKVLMRDVEADSLKVDTVTFREMAQGSAQKTAWGDLKSDVSIAQGQTVTVFSGSFVKEDNDSALKILAFLNLRSADDLQCDVSIQVDGMVMSQAQRINLVLDNSNSQAQAPLTPFVYVTGILAGPRTITVKAFNRETDNVPLIVCAGSAIEIAEMRKASIGSIAGSGEALPPPGSGGAGSGPGGSYSGGNYHNQLQ